MRDAERQRQYLVFVTFPSMEVAREVVAGLLEARVIACANLIPGIESHFHWQGRIERESEVLAVLKSDFDQLDRLESIVVNQHPYDTPEIITVRIAAGHAPYLDWLSSSLHPPDS